MNIHPNKSMNNEVNWFINYFSNELIKLELNLDMKWINLLLVGLWTKSRYFTAKLGRFYPELSFPLWSAASPSGESFQWRHNVCNVTKTVLLRLLEWREDVQRSVDSFQKDKTFFDFNGFASSVSLPSCDKGFLYLNF